MLQGLNFTPGRFTGATGATGVSGEQTAQQTIDGHDRRSV